MQSNFGQRHFGIMRRLSQRTIGRLTIVSLSFGLSLSLASCGGPPQSRTQDNNPAPAASPNASLSPAPSPSAKADAKPSPKSDAKPSEPSNADAAPKAPAESQPNDAPAAAPKADTPSSSAAQPLNPGKTEETTIYQFDENSGDFVAKKTTVPSQDKADALVGKVLASANSPDFKIENYRVKVENGTATVDLRLPPDAKRPFTAMSAYEQQAILGSVQKTLTNQPNLKIKSVQFTDGKEPLEF